MDTDGRDGSGRVVRAHRRGAAAGVAAGVVLLVLGGGASAQVAPAPDPPTHRTLRDNAPPDAEPTVPQPFRGYPDAPAFAVVPQRPQLTFYPCSACHDALPVNSERRALAPPHPAALHHGGGRIWCLDCHQARGRDVLHTLAGEPVDFNDAYLVCGQCHASRQRDWYYGAHGKRVANWSGPRLIYNCTHCHDPHDPAVKPRAPSPPPPMRAGQRSAAAHRDDAASGVSR